MSRKTGKPSSSRPAVSAAGARPVPATVLGSVIALLVAGAVGLFIGVQIASPSATDASITALREEEAKRDTVQIVELTELARSTADQLKPVIDGMRAALPSVDGTAVPDAQPVTAEQLTAWRQILVQQVERHSETPSGSTATNVARSGIRNAVGQLALALDTFAAARFLPAEQQQPILVLASRQRLLAVNDWSVAATQLDQINVDAGHGHQHVYLTDQPEGGALTGDQAPEGS